MYSPMVEITSDIAPVMHTPLSEIRGIPGTFVQGFARQGIVTVAELAVWAETPDMNGYEGEAKIRALRNIGADRANALFSALEHIGVDIDRPIPSLPWIS